MNPIERNVTPETRVRLIAKFDKYYVVVSDTFTRGEFIEAVLRSGAFGRTATGYPITYIAPTAILAIEFFDEEIEEKTC